MTLTVWSSSRYTFPLPEGHRFPVAKYAMLREAVIAEGIVPVPAPDPAQFITHVQELLARGLSKEA